MPELTRETFAHHTGAADAARRAARAPARSTSTASPSGSRQPCLVVTGGARPGHRLGADQADRRRRARARNGCSTTTAPTSATTSRTSTARWWPTGSASTCGERDDRRSRCPPRGRPRAARQTRYVDDIERPGLVHAAFVRTPHASAAITALACPIDADGLSRCSPPRPGGRVRPVPGRRSRPAPSSPTSRTRSWPRDEVRYVGQPVAAVIAPTRALAEDAAERVEVDYEPRDAVV